MKKCIVNGKIILHDEIVEKTFSLTMIKSLKSVIVNPLMKILLMRKECM